MDARRRRMLRAASCALAAALVSCCLPLAAFARTDGGDAVLGCSAADLGISEERLPGIDASHAALMDEEGTLWYGRAAGERGADRLAHEDHDGRRGGRAPGCRRPSS